MMFVAATLLITALSAQDAADRAFELIASGEWAGAAAALDEVRRRDEPAYVDRHLNYLRGRIAIRSGDYNTAIMEFSRTAAASPLQAVSSFGRLEAQIGLGNSDAATRAFDDVPLGFPEELLLRLADRSPPDASLLLLRHASGRPARLKRLSAGGNVDGLWDLLRERQDDDAGYGAALLLEPSVNSPQRTFLIAETFFTHRAFDRAVLYYSKLTGDLQFGPDAAYQIGRSLYWQERFPEAISAFAEVIRRFPEHRLAKEAVYQTGVCLWRNGDLDRAEETWRRILADAGNRAQHDAARRNLIDTLRSRNRPDLALRLIDGVLANRPLAAQRQMLLFTKAKVLFSMKQYAAALTLFRQLKQMRIRTVPGGTTTDEVRYLEALTLDRLGRKAEAEARLRRLESGSGYYAARAAIHLHTGTGQSRSSYCTDTSRRRQDQAVRHLTGREWSRDTSPFPDVVNVLMDLRLWDEALFWAEWLGRGDPSNLTELAWAAERYDRVIVHSRRLGPDHQDGVYPAGYRRIVCREAARHGLDPAWLHAIIWQESKYNPRARSGASARGLMQFIPETAETVGRELGLGSVSRNQLYDPELNIAMGAAYFASLLRQFGSPEMALAAYNGGPGNVERWRAKWPDESTEFFVADIGFVETKRYVLEVFRARSLYLESN